MRHPEVLLAPLLMVFDYYLTLLGAYLAEHSYRRHFKTAHYELNPFWQNAMVRRQWINLRHLAGVVLVGSLLVLLTDVLELNDVFFNALLGFVLTCYGLVLGRHLSNLLTFVHLARTPDDVTGEIHLSHNFVLSLSIYQLLATGIPIGLIAIFSPSDFVFGACCGCSTGTREHTLAGAGPQDRLRTSSRVSELTLNPDLVMSS
jgi:hypothetical protein